MENFKEKLREIVMLTHDWPDGCTELYRKREELVPELKDILWDMLNGGLLQITAGPENGPIPCEVLDIRGDEIIELFVRKDWSWPGRPPDDDGRSGPSLEPNIN
jgi:hypothetical protein